MIDLPILSADEAARADEPAPRHKMWRSPAHLKQQQDFAKTHQGEFMPGASEAPPSASRRQFLQIMGASMAMAGLTACRRPVEKILPYSRKPEEIIPGIPRYFATSMPQRGILHALLVESHEGRPTKVEGNPEHPVSQGASTVFQQASILNLYDPDRSKTVLRNGAESDWADFVMAARDLRRNAVGTRMAVLAEPTSSPTVLALREELQAAFPNLRWVSYQPEGEDPELLGLRQAVGRPVRPSYRFSQADTIVSLDADFLGSTAANAIPMSREFAQSRELDEANPAAAEMSRLYVVESTYTPTGGMADHRLRARAADIPAVAVALAQELGVSTGGTRAELPEASRAYVTAMAEDLRRAGSGGVVLAGDTQPPSIHALCAAINSQLGSEAVTYYDLPEEGADTLPAADQLVSLVQDMEAGRVDALLMIGVNPVYNAPPALGFREAMRRVENTIHVGLHVDETGQVASWHLPRAHYLEAWGDGRAYDGTLGIIQPLIAPLYDDAHSEVEVLGLLASGLDRSGYDLVRERWQTVLEGDFEDAWRAVLHAGFVPDSGYATSNVAALPIPLTDVPNVEPADLEVVFRLDPTLYAGEFANNAWMQECPDPVTKITWDNVAIMSRRTAEALGVSVGYDEGHYDASVVSLSLGGQTIELPAWVLPGHPDNSISVTFGYGRDILSTRSLRNTPFWDTDDETDIYGRGALAGEIGANTFVLRPAPNVRVLTGVQIAPTGEDYLIATTQDHGALDPEARPLFRQATLEEYRQNPAFVEEMDEYSPGEPFEEYPMLWQEDHPSDQPAFKDNPYYQNQWGMTIDLNSCSGCNACLVACQSENNIQVVGKDQVARGREMHWLRVDRYWMTDESAIADGELDNPQMVMQTVMCMHCENAPCEAVCPVAATSHSPDGINEMTYNRCIGTRYCSNNCPYKVRRFNFYNWAKTMPLTVQMAQNPNVTVRFRGVMEKCTFCVQRVRQVQKQVNVEERRIQDGEVVTACQQACPANAIVFGDLNDPNSLVAVNKRSPRNYEMLSELNVRPRLSYLGRVRNVNEDLLASLASIGAAADEEPTA